MSENVFVTIFQENGFRLKVNWILKLIGTRNSSDSPLHFSLVVIMLSRSGRIMAIGSAKNESFSALGVRALIVYSGERTSCKVTF